jgi:hypothetical protein
MATCVFHISDNKLTTVSGADEGTYNIVDNFATVTIEDTEYRFCPFTAAAGYSNNYITIDL